MAVKVSHHTSSDLYEKIKEEAERLGFIKVGFLRPKRPVFFDYFLNWLKEGRNADMHWLERYVEIRADPERILPGCRTIICLAYPYSKKVHSTLEGLFAARYSEPMKEDYHLRIKRLGKRIGNIIKKADPESKIRICVDSAPILERSLAYMAGIGFIGKNNMLIVPGYGSYVFLSEIFTTTYIEFPEKEPIEQNCNICENCLNACPTGALYAPYRFDSRLCMSYLTIEYSGEIKKGLAKKLYPFFLGCDRCQEVCPFNPKEEKEVCLPSAKEFIDMDEEEFKRRFGRTALSRAGIKKIKRNLRLIMDSL